jgi:hypothetical protein
VPYIDCRYLFIRKIIRSIIFLLLFSRRMDSNKRGFSLFGNYNLNESGTNVPGREWKIEEKEIILLCFISSFHTRYEFVITLFEFRSESIESGKEKRFWSRKIVDKIILEWISIYSTWRTKGKTWSIGIDVFYYWWFCDCWWVKEKDEVKDYELVFLGSALGSVSGLYRGICETRDLTGSVRTSS